MKKIFLFITILLSIILLSGCQKVVVEQGMLNVVFENPRYEDGYFYIDTHITNGFDEEMYVGYMEFGIYPVGSEIEVAAAGFNIDETIKAGGYVSIELEFGLSYVFINEEELNNLGFSVDELELYFWLVE